MPPSTIRYIKQLSLSQAGSSPAGGRRAQPMASLRTTLIVHGRGEARGGKWRRSPPPGSAREVRGGNAGVSGESCTSGGTVLTPQRCRLRATAVVVLRFVVGPVTASRNEPRNQRRLRYQGERCRTARMPAMPQETTRRVQRRQLQRAKCRRAAAALQRHTTRVRQGRIGMLRWR